MSTTPDAFTTWSAVDFLRHWLPQAQSTVVQPILPGWQLNINSNNSSSPATEADIVAHHSYGRQIGRISDALHALILASPQPLPEHGPLRQFITMWQQIETLKIESASARLRQIGSDLALLKAKDEAAYLHLRD